MRLVPALVALLTAVVVAWMATFGQEDALFVQASQPPPAAARTG